MVAKTRAAPPCHTLMVPARSSQKRRPSGAKARATGKLAGMLPAGEPPGAAHETAAGGGGGGGGGRGGGGGGAVGEGDGSGDADGDGSGGGDGVTQAIVAHALGLGFTAVRPRRFSGPATTSAPSSSPAGTTPAATWAGLGRSRKNFRSMPRGYLLTLGSGRSCSYRSSKGCVPGFP